MNARMPSTGKPKFIMVGVDRPDGTVRLYASRELPTDLGWGQREIRNHIIAWHIDADMTQMLIIDKPTWGEAFMRAFEIWDSQDREKHPLYALDTVSGEVRPARPDETARIERMRGRVLDGPANLAAEAASEGDSQ